jgi:hypothetical protein
MLFTAFPRIAGIVLVFTCKRKRFLQYQQTNPAIFAGFAR